MLVKPETVYDIQYFFLCVRATRLLTVPYLSVIEDRPDVRRS